MPLIYEQLTNGWQVSFMGVGLYVDNQPLHVGG